MLTLQLARRWMAVLVVVVLIGLLTGVLTRLPGSLQPSPVAAQASRTCSFREDITGDGLVNVVDIQAVVGALGAEPAPAGYDHKAASAEAPSSEVVQAAYQATLADVQRAESKAPGGVSLLASGGPDAFGYTYIDSDDPGGPTFVWGDISATGTNVGAGNDTTHGPYGLGFTFNFYGSAYTQLWLSSNGWLSFTDPASSDPSNDCPLPSTNGVENLIAAIWDDLDAAGGDVYYLALAAGSCGTYPGACFIAQWDNVVHYGTSDDLTFEIILFDNGTILVQILDASDEAGSGSTTGIENADASSGLTYACNSSGSIADNRAILFKPPLVVNTTADTDDGSCDLLNGTDCSLRDAINVANALPGKDTIKFNIPAGTTGPVCSDVTGVCTIQPLSALPVITGTVLIDGYTQPGAAPATATTDADLKIVIDGSQAGNGVDGLVLYTDDSTVKGLVIHSFQVHDISNYGYIFGNGIVIRGHSASGVGNNNVIVGNFIGTDVTGTACVGNGGSGVLIGGPYSAGDTDNNTVGGTNPADRNVITCNGFQRDTGTPDPDDGTATGADGVTIRANLQDSTFYSADGNTVVGNYIGTDVTGMTTLEAGTQTFTYDSQTFDITYMGNTGNGVRIAGGSSNMVGGTTEGARNIISGDEVAGVRIEAVAFDDPPTLTRAANSNVVQGNYIGTDVNGTGDLGNRDVGVYVVGRVDDADSNQIGGTTGTTPGGSCTGACNTISGNGGGGVMILGGGASGNEVKGNYIGTDVNGTAAIPNDGDGIAIADAEDNTIGGTTPDERNLVSGNRGHGISILNNAKAWSPAWETFLGVGEASGNTIQGNYIGTEVDGATPLPNTLSGVLITDAAGNTVGGTTGTTPGGPCTGACNTISGNGANGVLIATTSGASGNVETDVVTVEGTANGNYVKGGDSATVTITDQPGAIEVTKTADPTHVAAVGDPVTFTIGITNSGALDVAIKRLSDSSHGNLNGQGTCSVPQTLGPGLGYTCVFSATVSGDAGDSATDTVTASGTDQNGDFVINSASATVNITDLPAMIVVTKTVDSAVVAAPGGTVNFTVTVKNVTVSETATITKTWDTKHGDLDGQGTCSVPQTLVPGGSYTCSFSATVSGATGNTIEGNFIGTDVTGAVAVPNQRAGVAIVSAPDNTIEDNVISGNAQEGVAILGADATGNLLRQDLIGTQADGTSSLGNGSHGVFFAGDPSDNAIGSSTGMSNTIAYNGGDGVVAFSGTGNQILSNSIFTNTELGIDLGTNGVTPNDDDDPDAGANNLQNFPVLTSASVSAGKTTIGGVLNSISNTNFTIQFFANTVCDPSGFGEGHTYLDTDTTTTDGAGNATTSVMVDGDLTGQFVTATATDPYSNTSEFSNCIPVPAAPVLSISKQVQNLNGGAGLPGDTLQYTISYTNTGNAPASGVFITDTYSTYCITRTNVTDGDFPNHDDNGTRLRWPTTGGIVLDAQASGSVSYQCTLAGASAFPDVATQVTNTATLDSNETDPEEDTETVCILRFDFNRNGEVDAGDVQAVAAQWRLTAADPNYEAQYDVDGDGVITVVDIMRVVDQWGQTCP